MACSQREKLFSPRAASARARSCWPATFPKRWTFLFQVTTAAPATENMGAFQPYPAYIGPGKRAVAPEVALAGGIMVDAGGKRFVDETRYPGGLGIKMLDLPGKQAYE